MNDLERPPRAFRGPARSSRGRDRAGVLVVAIIAGAFIGLAVAKPWGPSRASTSAPGPSPSAASASPSGRSIEEAAGSGDDGGPGVAGATASRASLDPFTTPAPPPSGRAWTGLRWRRLGPGDPLGLVTSIVRWRGGFVATGWTDSPTGQQTPVWTSRDGVRWDPLSFGTGTTFWPRAIVLGVVTVPGGLVAVTEQAGSGCPVCGALVPPVVSWTSADGRSWVPHPLPSGALPTPPGTSPLIAGGAGGIVLASSGTGHRVVVSADGIRWHVLPADTLPAAFVLDDLERTAHGYVAAGRWVGAEVGRGAVLSSADGRSWGTPTVLPQPAGLRPGLGSTVDRLVDAAAGLIAIGHTIGAPAPSLWWQGGSGGGWRTLSGYPPLGSWSPSGAAVRARPHGWLVDDGIRMVAVRGGTDAAGWASADGRTWQRLAMSGEVPTDHAAAAALLPGGVLVVDGPDAWFGEAVLREDP